MSAHTMHTDAADLDCSCRMKRQIENENVRDRLMAAFRRCGRPMTIKKLAEESGVGWCKVAMLIHRSPNTFSRNENSGIKSKCRNHVLALVEPHPHITAYWPEWGRKESA